MEEDPQLLLFFAGHPQLKGCAAGHGVGMIGAGLATSLHEERLSSFDSKGSRASRGISWPSWAPSIVGIEDLFRQRAVPLLALPRSLGRSFEGLAHATRVDAWPTSIRSRSLREINHKCLKQRHHDGSEEIKAS